MAGTAAYKLRVIAEKLRRALEGIRASSSIEPKDLEAALRKLDLIRLLAAAALEEHPVSELYRLEAASAT